MFKTEYFLYGHKHSVLRPLYDLIFNSFRFDLGEEYLTTVYVNQNS